jgi:hypothetical protein
MIAKVWVAMSGRPGTNPLAMLRLSDHIGRRCPCLDQPAGLTHAQAGGPD